MVHLIIHLVEEIRLGGPVTFRWMYPIERYLLTLKNYVHNRAHPEGSIAEGYMAQESMTFCSRYFSGVETLFNRPIRNDDSGDQSEFEESNSLRPGRPLRVSASKLPNKKRKRWSNCEIDSQSLAQAHRYVLFNVNLLEPFREEHLRTIRAQNRSRRRPQYEIEKTHSEEFSDWLKKRVARLEEVGDARATEEVKWLSRGPNDSVKRYSGYLVNGYRFHTKEHEKLLKSQNSGVVVTVRSSSCSTARNTRLVEEVVKYYGSLKDIIQLNYSGKIRVVLFRCDWIDINRGCKKDVFGATLVNFSYLAHTGTRLLDDPFILASQAEKVFYAKDAKSDEWLVARHVKVRDTYDLGDEPQLSSDCNANADMFKIGNLHRSGEDGDDVDDVIPMMGLGDTGDMEDIDEA